MRQVYAAALLQTGFWQKRSQDVHETSGGNGRQYYTILAANGTRLPPFILYKGTNLYLRWTKEGPARTVYGMSNSGWMEENNFLKWFKKLLVPAVAPLNKTGPIVPFLNRHFSHLSLGLMQFAKDQGINISVCLFI